jgi:hypothetical protein
MMICKDCVSVTKILQENAELKKALENAALGEYNRYLSEAKEELEAQDGK